MARPAPPSSTWSLSASPGPPDRPPAPPPAPLDLRPDGLAPLAEPAQLVEEDHQRHTERHRVRDARLARSPAPHRAVVHLELLRQGRLPAPCPIEAGAGLAQPVRCHGLFVVLAHRFFLSLLRRPLRRVGQYGQGRKGPGTLCPSPSATPGRYALNIG